MNKRQKKKKDKRSFIGLDEFNLIGMTQDEVNEVFKKRELYRKKYGYRKKYKSNKRLKLFYIMPSQSQSEVDKLIFNSCRPYRSGKSCYTTVTQSLEELINLHN